LIFAALFYRQFELDSMC